MAIDVERGLTAAEVAERVADGRTNDVPTASARSVARIVGDNVLTRFNAILGATLVVIVLVARCRTPCSAWS